MQPSPNMHPLLLSSSQEWLCQTVLSIIVIITIIIVIFVIIVVIIFILITKVTVIKVIVNQTKIARHMLKLLSTPTGQCLSDQEIAVFSITPLAAVYTFPLSYRGKYIIEMALVCCQMNIVAKWSY